MLWLGATAVVGLRLWVRSRTGTVGPDQVAWCTLAAVTGGAVTSKVLSPQYLPRLLPVAVAAVAVAPYDRRLRRWLCVLLVAIGATQPVFPLPYDGLTDVGGQTLPATLVPALRSLLLAGLAVAAVRAAHLAHTGPGDAWKPRRNALNLVA